MIVCLAAVIAGTTWAINAKNTATKPVWRVAGVNPIRRSAPAEKSRKLNKGHVEMVAQTIFPGSRLYFACPDPRDPNQREELYDQYMKDKSFIRALIKEEPISSG